MALDFDKEKGNSTGAPCQETYLLPDGQEIRLGPERFVCPEALFQPDLIGEWAGTGTGCELSCTQDGLGYRRLGGSPAREVASAEPPRPPPLVWGALPEQLTWEGFVGARSA